MVENAGEPSGNEPAKQRVFVASVAALRRHWRRVALMSVAVVTVLFLALPFLALARSSGRALAGVRVAGEDVSGKDSAALAQRLTGRARELERRRTSVRVAGRPFDVDPAALGFRIDVKATAERALVAGRGESLLSRWAGYYRRWFAPEELGLVARLDGGKLERVLSDWEKLGIADSPFAGGIRVEGSNVTALAPRAGRLIERRAAREVLLGALVSPSGVSVEMPIASVPAPLPKDAAEAPAQEARALVGGPLGLELAGEAETRLSLSPAELGPALGVELANGTLRLSFELERLKPVLDRLRAAVELEPVDARYEIGPRDAIKVVPSRDGRRLDVARLPEALLAASRSPERSAALPLISEPKPALDTQTAEALGIRRQVSSFTTRHPCCEPRVENIHRIADIMKGKLLRPGETASLNALVGPRTKANGFVPAPTIEEGEFVDSLGGGVSQFATTFFNALFHGGYDIVERQPHSYWFPRYPMGHEATLSWPKPDVIFRNDTEAGLLIETAYTGTSITVKLYGDNAGRKVKAHVSRRENIVEPAVELLPNPAVAPDEERVKESGMIGWSVIVSRVITFTDGTTREDRRRVTYKPRPRRLELHPCRIPKGEKGYTGDPCPEPENVEVLDEEAEG